MPDPGPGEVPAAAAAPPPALPEVVEPPPQQAPILVAEASGQHFEDLAPAEPPQLYPPLPISRMPSSAYTLPQHHSPSLPLNWEDPVRGTKQQLTWTPPQGFKNSPTIFREALASDLDSFHPEKYRCWLLHYVDDLLLVAETKEKCWKGTKALFRLLMEAGYWVSKKKAQICKEVRYPGFVLKKGTRFQTLVGSYILMALA